MKFIIGAIAGLGTILATGVAIAATRGRRARSRVTVTNRVLYGPGGFSYQLTNDDLLWLARAVWGEADVNTRGGAAVIWAMAQYHALVIGAGNRRPAFSTLLGLLRAYCQPINPRWASPEAAGCVSRPAACTQRHLDRRARITNASWEQIPRSVRDLVVRFAAGQLDNPVPGAVDWADEDWSSRSSIPLINIEGNYFGVGRVRRLYEGA